MEQFNQIESILPSLIIVLGVLVIISFIWIIIQAVQLSKLKNVYRKFMNGLDNKNMEELLIHHMEKINQVSLDLRDIQGKFQIMESKLQGSIQKFGIVRYSAFDDTGSDLSFVAALLNEKDDGFVINGIYGRSSTYTYAKPIIEGKSSYKLSEEELEALKRAQTYYEEQNK